MNQLTTDRNGHRRPALVPDRAEHQGGQGDAGRTLESSWAPVCRLEQLQPGRGVAALVGGTQVALFRVSDAVGGAGGDAAGGVSDAVGGAGGDALYAIGNVDPCSGAAVLSRGIVGDRRGEPVVASPLYKQAFSLVTGQCLDEPDKSVPVYRVRMWDGWVEVGLG